MRAQHLKSRPLEIVKSLYQNLEGYIEEITSSNLV